MLKNKVIITSKNKKNEIYELSKNKWIIEIEGDNIANWGDFYDLMQKDFDVVNYHNKFGKSGHTYDDFISDEALFHEVQKRKVEGIVLILNYTDNFINMLSEEKIYIYNNIIYSMLVGWYRDYRIIYNNENFMIDIEMYILVDKENIFTNELIVAITEDISEINKKYSNYIEKKIEINCKVNEAFYENLKNQIKDQNIISNKLDNEINKRNIDTIYKIVNDGSNQLKLLLYNSDEIFFYHGKILLYIIEGILIKKYTDNEEIKIFMIFSNDM